MMLIEVNTFEYEGFFKENPNPFISPTFLELNSRKVTKVVRLIRNEGKPQLGLVGGIIDKSFKAPFSAPFSAPLGTTVGTFLGPCCTVDCFIIGWIIGKRPAKHVGKISVAGRGA